MLVWLWVLTAQAETVAATFPPPKGAMVAPKSAFGRWLGARELRPEGTPVRTHKGDTVGAPHSAAEVRVVDLPLVAGDLQQCADTAYRLRAEFLREQNAADITFHATNGQALPWTRWSQGETTTLRGNTLVWGPASPRKAGWEGYLRELFTYAGTLSLERLDTVPADAPRAGDVVVSGGSPGHAIIVLDVARTADGDWLMVVGEGFMPAQDFHVHPGPVDGWWPWHPETGLALPWWPLPAEGLRRWKD